MDAVLSRISSWVDTRYSVQKALARLGPGQAAAPDTFLPPGANQRFLELHRDMGEECGPPGRRQHSWAAIEKPDEVLMYGPYYPDYASGEHSEDLVVRQTEQLLAAEDARVRGCGVYVFTQNSPCLDRDAQPCMLHLVEKALEWHALYGVRTHIGYAKCWGFKGNKEALFRGVDRGQLACVAASRDHESYVDAAKKLPGGEPGLLSKDLFSAVRRTLEAGPEKLKFPMRRGAAEPNWKGYFEGASGVSEGASGVSEGASGVSEGAPQSESEAPAPETSAAAEAARRLLCDGVPRSLEDHVERGRAFAREHGLGPEASEAARAEARLAFVRRWGDAAEGRRAEFVRDRLTDDFNRCVTNLFSQDVVQLDKDYVQIGRIRFSGERRPSAEESSP